MLQSIMIKALASFWSAIGEVFICFDFWFVNSYIDVIDSMQEIFSFRFFLRIFQLNYHHRRCSKIHMIWLILQSLKAIYHPIIHYTVIVKCVLLNALVMHYSTKSKRGHTFDRMLPIYRENRTHSKLIHLWIDINTNAMGIKFIINRMLNKNVNKTTKMKGAWNAFIH